MGTRTYYTHAQAAMLLGVDDKTLNEWLRKAPPEIRFQPSAADGRVKVISRTKLARLASLHQKTLPDNDEEILEADTRHAKSPALLTLKVEEMEQRLELLGGIFQQTVSELQGQIGALNERIKQVEQQAPQSLPPSQPERRLPQPPARPQTRVVASVIPPRGRQSSQSADENLCSVREFCRLHNTTRDWIEPRIADETLAAERRPYGQREQRLFTNEQQDAAVQWLTEHFPNEDHRCLYCPHSQPREESNAQEA